MKQQLKVRILSLILAVVMTLNMVPDMALNVYAAEMTETTEATEVTESTETTETTEVTEVTESTEATETTETTESEIALVSDEGSSVTNLDTLDTSKLSFDVEDPDGYVTISFVDQGDRSETTILDEELYGKALGTIIGKTEVPYKKGDTIATITVRLFEAMNLSYSNDGKVDDGFYLKSLKNFQFKEKYYSQFGEFDAGDRSGWCVRLNNWHINQGTSAFEVEDGDTISWLYTCKLGADIGADYSSKSAAITAVKFTDATLALTAVDGKEKEYTCEVAEDISSIAFTVELENYGSVVSVEVDGQSVKYRPDNAISVTKNSNIVISTELEYMDANDNNKVTTYTDSWTIQLTPPAPVNTAPAVKTNVPSTMSVEINQEITVNFEDFFEDADGDELTYCIKIAALGLDQEIAGSVYAGSVSVAGTYEVVLTANDGTDVATHTITLTVTAPADPDNHAPALKAEFAETKGKTYVYSSSYVYIYMDDIFEDADGDELTYKATCDGEEVVITYNSWSKQYYIQFAAKPAVKVYEIVANDGKADSEVFTAKCIGTSATITAAEDTPLIPSGTYYYYVKGTAENDTFALEYTLDVNEKLDTEWISSNRNVLISNGDGKYTVSDKVTTRQQSLYVGVTCGKDTWGSDIYLGTKNFYILPAMPEFKDITAELAEHADNQIATTESNAVTGGWYSNEFDYAIEDPSICSITTSGTYGLSVTPKALGTTKVTATFKYDESIKYDFEVTVTGCSLQIKDQPGVDSIIYKENETVQMEVLGAENGETFTWTSADENVATIDENGLVTLKGLGQTYITAISSLSTENKTVKASMYLQVKEAGKVYLEDIALTAYSYFEGHISAKSGFNSAQLVYDWSLKESNYSYSTLAFTPYFDDETLTAVLHYQVSGGEYQMMELENGKAVSIANGLNPGPNVVMIDVYPSDDEENITTYTFNIFRTYNPSNTITRMTIYPNGETALTYPTYKDNKEGTLFQWDSENNDFVINPWNGKPVTSWSSTVYNYKTFVYGSRTSSISVSPTFAYSGQRVMIYVDGVELEEAVTNWKSKVIPIDSEKTTKIEFHVNSEKYHAEQLAAGVEDPFTAPEKIYTLYVESVEPLGIDAEILSAELDGGEFYKPGFSSKVYTISALLPADQSSTGLTFTVPAGIDVYKGTVNASNKLEAWEQDEDGNNVFKTELTITGTAATAYSTTNIILQVTDEEGNVGQAQYAFTILRRGTKDIYPDSIEDYLCIGSQYTNLSSYGTMPERTLKAGGVVLSLGNYGGYIVYKYEKPIENNPNNPYGVDFVAYGNSFGNGGHEPGYVQVSKDGETWYTLAGSSHFDDYCDWDFWKTYVNTDGKSSWTDSDGATNTESLNYPSVSAYPYFNWTDELQKSITATGPVLKSASSDAYGSAAAALPVFGYVDVNTNGTINGTSNNPYNHPGALAAGGDMFDLDWAVDEDGMPVELDSISYIRIATASSIWAGAIGEKSTEVTAVLRVTNTAEDTVGETARPTSVKVNGTEIDITDDEQVFEAVYDPEYRTGEENDKVLKVEVEASEDANIYINDTYGASREYTVIPEKEIIRIIVQEGEKEPAIIYLTLKDKATAEVEDVIAKIDAIGEVTLNSEQKIADARAAYDALTAEQKALVTNYETLTLAEEKLAYLKREPVDETLSSEWPSFRGNSYNNGITSAQTPRKESEADLLWAKKMSTGWSDAPSPMIIVDDTIFTMCGSTLKKIDKNTGEVLATVTMAAATNWGTVPPTYGGGMIFCPLANGTIQAFNAKTLESLWVYKDANGGQSQSPIAYADGYVYVGFGYGREYAFVCLSANDEETGVKEATWRVLDNSGFYWAGAVVVGDYVVYGNDAGHLFSRNKETGALITELTVNESAKIRSSVTYDNGKIYFTLNNATLCMADLDAKTGELTNLKTVDCSAYGSASTSTPVVYKGMAYIGAGSWSGSKNIVCVDTETLEIKWAIAEPAYPQCSVLLSIAYEESGYIYLYVTYNANPGGINVIKAKADGSEATQSVLYDAEGYEQYCVCSVLADSDGTLYYKNDSGNIFALAMNEQGKQQLQDEAKTLEIYKTTGDYLENLSKTTAPTVSSIGGEWLVLGLVRSGREVPEGYYQNAVSYVEENINSKEQLDSNKSTDNSRLILALTAAGYDVTNVAGHNLLMGLTDMNYVKYQGFNGPIWALIALDSHDYEIPENTAANPVTREKLIAEIVNAALENGGWVLDNEAYNTADPDVTAMAIQALAPYYDDADYPEVKTVVDKALDALSGLQQSDGGFITINYANSESSAQVLTALTSIGIDPLEDTRFIKNGNTVIDAFCNYYVEGGGFKHIASNTKLDGMATEQGYYALASYYRMTDGKTSLYDMSDVEIKKASDVAEDLIAKIGSVSAGSEAAIKAARTAYDALTTEEKNAVSNYAVLLAAEEAYAEIAKKIANVKELIDAIGTVKYNKTSADKIEAARKAYDKLTSDEKNYIDNYATLTAAEKKYSQIKNADKVMDLIDKIGTVTTDSEDDIKAARKAYDALTKEEKALVDNYSTLTKAERKLAALLEPEGETKTLADGVTKVIGDGDTEVKIGDVLYLVDEAAATLMEKIEALAAKADPAAEDIIALYKEYDAMSADLKAQVFNYDDLEAMTNKLGIENHKDAATGMSVDGVEWYIKLVVEEISGTDEYDGFANSIGNNTLVKLWDIYLLNLLTGEKVQTVQNLTLKIGNIDVSDFEEIRIARLTDAGTMEYLECTVVDGYLTWKTNDLSLFGLIGGQGEAKNVLEEAEDTVEEEVTEAETVDAVIEETEEDGIPWMWIMLIVLGVAVLAAVIVLKKKNESNSVE